MTLADFGDLGLLALALAGWLGREGISRWRRPAQGRKRTARAQPVHARQPKEAR